MFFYLKFFNLLPEFFFCLSLIFLLIYGTILSSTLKVRRLIIKPIINLALLILIFSTFLFWNNLASLNFFSSYFFGSISVDILSEISKMIIAIFSFFCLCFFQYHLSVQKINNFEYIIIILLAVLGVFLLCSANDLLVAYLSIELQSLAFYILASFKKHSSFSIHAGLKYFILGALASCLFLFSSSILYGITGSINFEDIFIFLDFGNFYSLNGCLTFFLQKLLNVTCFSFYYSFDTLFEDIVIDLYFCLLHASFITTDSFSFLEDNFTTIFVLLNKFIYYGDSSFFNFMPLLFLGEEYVYFFIECYYIPVTFYQSVFLYCTGLFELLVMDLSIIMNSLFFSVTCLSFFFFDNFNNSYILDKLEFYLVIGFVFQHIDFLVTFCLDLFWTESFINWNFLTNYFVLDMCFYYFRFYNLFSTIIFASSIFFLLFSIFFKLAVVPFHLWLPDVYEGSLTSTTSFFAIIPKLSIFVLLIRFLHFNLIDCSSSFQFLFLLLGVISVAYGAFIAIEERKLKSLIAFSAISNVGFIFVGFSAFTGFAQVFILCYLVIYMLANMLVWFVVLMYTEHKKTIDYRKFNKELSSFSNFYRSNKVMSFLFSFTLFSIAGIPPFIGFIAKFGVFFVTLETSLFSIAVFCILCSILSIFYYLRIIKLIFFENNDDNLVLFKSRSSFFNFFFIGCFLILFLLFLNPKLIYLSIIKIGYSLL